MKKVFPIIGLNDYRSIINIVKDIKIIFAPNSSGKTLYSESFIEINSSNDNYVTMNKKTFFDRIQKSFTTINKITTAATIKNDSFDFSLPNIEHEYKISHNDLEMLNAYLKPLSISIRRNDNLQRPLNSIKDLQIKKEKIIKFADINTLKNRVEDEWKVKLKLSSSEFEYLINSLIIFFCKSIDKTLIWDDPIEMASWEFEEKFCDMLSNVKFKQPFQILTHRHTLFERLISINKKLGNVSYIFYVDGMPFWWGSKTGEAIRNYLWPELIKVNKIAQRIYREDIHYKVSYINKIWPSKNLSNFVGENILLFNLLSQNKPKIDGKQIHQNIATQGIVCWLDMKIVAFSTIRELFLDYINNLKSVSSPVENLEDILSKYFVEIKRLFNDTIEEYQVKRIFRSLNSLMHKSDWHLFSEIDCYKLCFTLYNNLKGKSNIKKFVENLLTVMQSQHESMINLETIDLEHEKIVLSLLDIKFGKKVNDVWIYEYYDDGDKNYIWYKKMNSLFSNKKIDSFGVLDSGAIHDFLYKIPKPIKPKAIKKH